MNISEYKNFLLQNIQPWAKEVSGGREINCRCFYCPDSKTRSKGHMYIKIPQSENDVSTFYCQKCKTTGIVTAKTLMEWDSYDPSIASELTAYNKTVLNKPQNRMFRDYDIYRINNVIPKDSKLSRFKLKYINDRLGTNLTYQDCMNLKIVLNLKDIIMANNLKYTRHPQIVDVLDIGFMGFLSHDNAFINMRNLDIMENLHESIDKRYINYNLVGKFDNTCRFYTVPTSINFLTLGSQPLQIHIAEGSFDILSIYLNLRKNPINAIYTAIGGSGYKGILRYFISKLRIPNLEIHIYPDADISRDSMINLAYYLQIFGYSMYIHRNTFQGEKDFGVPLNRIDEVIERIM